MTVEQAKDYFYAALQGAGIGGGRWSLHRYHELAAVLTFYHGGCEAAVPVYKNGEVYEAVVAAAVRGLIERSTASGKGS